MITVSQRSLTSLVTLAILSCAGCAPDESPFRQENENLRKQLAKQESVTNSLQDGNKVMQQQIDLLNQELRDARKQTEHAQAEVKALQGEAKALGAKLESQMAEAKKLSGEIQRTAAKAAQATDNIRVEEKASQVEDLPRPLAAVAKAAEEALARNGYHVRVSVKTEQKAVFVTERKVSTPASLEMSGFRNQYVVSLQALPSNVTRLSVKAEFEKLVQGGRVSPVNAEETADIERRLIAEIGKALSSPSKL
jgi:predicted  nucleic acid-binding Zn-ribbon protein